MAFISESIDLDASVSDAWTVLSDFGAISDWIPSLQGSSCEGRVRECDLGSGLRLVEEISNVNEVEHSYEYTITEAPFEFESHRATIKVDLNDSGSRVIWTTEIVPDELLPLFESVLPDGLASLKRVLDGAN